jgi:hypothetical protein
VDEAGDQLPAIDRIVVYIDDLDRCPPARVVEMLEAIHLLLAVELFVVVVAVAPRWLLQALHSHYRDQLTAPATGAAVTDDGQALWQPSAVQYLEKIFQVVLTLPPLAADGYVNLVDSLINPQDETRRTGGGQQLADEATAAPAPVTASPPADADTREADPREDGPSTGIVDLPVPRIIERSDPLAFSGDEQRLLHLLGRPLSPRPRQSNGWPTATGFSAHFTPPTWPAATTATSLATGQPWCC